jgi:hypothetical protein
MKILFLDDDQTRHNFFRDWCQEKGHMDVTHVFTADGAAEALAADTFDLIFLDHDLGEEHYGAVGEKPGDGTGLARWMSKEWDYPEGTRIVVHSWNHSGAARMMDHLWEMEPVWSPFGPGLKKFL